MDERMAIQMRSDENTIKNVKQWLAENDKTQVWLAKKIGIAPSLISQLFRGSRKLQHSHIEEFSKITGLTISELAASKDSSKSPIYSLRGKISNEQGERGLSQLLLDVEHYVQLINK